MPKHNVYFNLPARELGNSDIIIEIFSDPLYGTQTGVTLVVKNDVFSVK